MKRDKTNINIDLFPFLFMGLESKRYGKSDILLVEETSFIKKHSNSLYDLLPEYLFHFTKLEEKEIKKEYTDTEAVRFLMSPFDNHLDQSWIQKKEQFTNIKDQVLNIKKDVSISSLSLSGLQLNINKQKRLRKAINVLRNEEMNTSLISALLSFICNKNIGVLCLLLDQHLRKGILGNSILGIDSHLQSGDNDTPFYQIIFRQLTRKTVSEKWKNQIYPELNLICESLFPLNIIYTIDYEISVSDRDCVLGEVYKSELGKFTFV